MTLPRGLRRFVHRTRPRAYCWECRWTVPQTRGLPVDRVGEMARQHARGSGHRSRVIVEQVTEYMPYGHEQEAARDRLHEATAEATRRSS